MSDLEEVCVRVEAWSDQQPWKGTIALDLADIRTVIAAARRCEQAERRCEECSAELVDLGTENGGWVCQECDLRDRAIRAEAERDKYKAKAERLAARIGCGCGPELCDMCHDALAEVEG